jgi:hypothetical protein
MKRFKQLVRETAVEPDMPSAAARTYKEKPNKEPMAKLKEGRLSQRHPLEGHEYHKKTDAELVHIAKDAHKAAEAMKSHNTDAENKYRDQANDSATVRYFRKKSGMPDWYKKKYGHVKEETEQQKHPFVAVHAKKGMHQTHGSTSYEAAQNAAKHWKMKNTAGIDVYRADKKHIPEEVEQIDELSNELLGRYKDKAVVSHGEAEKAKNYKLSDKRFSGVVKATNKQFANFRKKPFSVKEETEQLDEISAETKASYTQKATKDIEQLKPHAEKGEYKDMAKNIITRRQKGIAMAKEEKEPPFTPDKPKKQQVVPGKHGAGYSTARHLARQAMKKQVEKMKPVKESLEESRKAEIVKEIVKKKKNEKNDTESFQKDPVLSSEITKA